MLKAVTVLFLLCFAAASTEPRGHQRRGLAGNKAVGASNHPYLFLRVPGSRAGASLQGLEVIEEDDDYSDDGAMINDEDFMDENNKDENDAEEDDEDDFASAELENTQVFKKNPSNIRKNIKYQHISEEDDDDIESAELEVTQPYTPMPSNKRTKIKPHQMLISRDHTGTKLDSDSFVELEAHTIIDTKTGELSLMVPREVFESIPGGSIVTLTAPSFDESQPRANQVANRHRHRNGFRINVNGSGGNRNIQRPGSSNAQRRVNKTNNVRIMRQNVNGRPTLQKINRRPVQTITRRRVTQS